MLNFFRVYLRNDTMIRKVETDDNTVLYVYRIFREKYLDVQ